MGSVSVVSNLLQKNEPMKKKSQFGPYLSGEGRSFACGWDANVFLFCLYEELNLKLLLGANHLSSISRARNHRSIGIKRENRHLKFIKLKTCCSVEIGIGILWLNPLVKNTSKIVEKCSDWKQREKKMLWWWRFNKMGIVADDQHHGTD